MTDPRVFTIPISRGRGFEIQFPGDLTKADLAFVIKTLEFWAPRITTDDHPEPAPTADPADGTAGRQ